MWEKTSTPVPQELASLVTGVYALGDYCLAFVLRPSWFAPPYLGMQFFYLPSWLLRQRKQRMDELHVLLGEPVFLAEPDEKVIGAEKFLTFLGFQPHQNFRNLFERRI